MLLPDAVMQIERVDHEGRAIEVCLGERAAECGDSI